MKRLTRIIVKRMFRHKFINTMIQGSNVEYYAIITVLCLLNKTNLPLINYYRLVLKMTKSLRGH